MIDYNKILNKNLINVLKDILIEIEKNGIAGNNSLYITFLTVHKNVKLPEWLKKKFPKEITIVIQYEYSNLKINKDNFIITLSFSDIKSTLEIGYDAIISFSDPSANFGLSLSVSKNKKINKAYKRNNINNVIDFEKFKKN